MDPIQKFVAAVSAASTTIANKITTIVANTAVNNGALTGTDATDLQGAVTKLQALATQGNSVANAAPTAVSAAATKATAAVGNVNKF